MTNISAISNRKILLMNRRMTAQTYSDVAWNWNAWGPWGPPVGPYGFVSVPRLVGSGIYRSK